MRRTATILGLGLGLLAILGCAEEKKLATKALIQDNKPAAASLESTRPEKEDPAAREIVNKAIAAHTNGKPERLEGIKAQHVLLQGYGLTENGEKDGSRESWAVWPNLFAFRFGYRPDNERELVSTGVSTATGGFQSGPNGQPTPFTGEYVKAFQWDLFALEWTLTPKALTHPQAVFHQPGKATKNDRAFNTVKAFIPGNPTWTLYFDEKTSLLGRVEYIGLEGNAAPKTLTYAEHQEREGLKVPNRVEVFSGGLKFWDIRKLDKYELFESADKIDPKKFEIP